MVSKDFKAKEFTLSESKLKKVIEQIEDKDNSLNKFKNTSIYYIFVRNYNLKIHTK